MNDHNRFHIEFYYFWYKFVFMKNGKKHQKPIYTMLIYGKNWQKPNTHKI